MKTIAGVAGPEKLFRELRPGETFQFTWRGKFGDYMTTDLTRAAPTSDKPWDYRAAIDIESGTAIWLAESQTVSPTEMGAGPL